MLDALYKVLQGSGVDYSDMLIFLPSRRAVRSVERFLVDKAGHSIILPKLVALGEGIDDIEEEKSEAVSKTMRVVIAAKLLAADEIIGNITNALPLAHDLIRMQDYLENEGIDAAQIDWSALVDEKYAVHFQRKAKLLNILSMVQSEMSDNRPTETQVRNEEIRAWIKYLNKYKLVIVCGSTASVPATADLMTAIAKLEKGCIILSGHIDGDFADFNLNTNPYNSEYRFLSKIGITPKDLIPINVGHSPMDFFNFAFSNNTAHPSCSCDLSNCHLINCERESEEAAVVAEIGNQAVKNGKSVLVITPDSAGNQRIASAFAARGLTADFSGGTPGNMTSAGRALLNKLDEWLDQGKSSIFDNLYSACDYNLTETIIHMVDECQFNFLPSFETDSPDSIQIWKAIKNLSDCLTRSNLTVGLRDIRSLISDTIGSLQIRNNINNESKISVLGTIESRMQTADVVILTGLNDGMFPSRGYENAWLPRDVAEKIGLPSPDRKVSLQSLDFMNLSCGKEVYWTRSFSSGGVKTVQSRFLSRVDVREGKYDIKAAQQILEKVRGYDIVASMPLDYSAPVPPEDWNDIYVTELELLIHNPYAFYVRHMLRLRVLNDYWATPDARDFGNLVHEVIEKAKDFSQNYLLKEMDTHALEKLGGDSVLFYFWHKRFIEISSVVSKFMPDIINSIPEIEGVVTIDGHNIRARADRVWDGGVLDIKTGAVPTKSQLEQGNMPQLPLEAYMLQKESFPIKTTIKSKTPVMTFLQLKNGDVRTICYDADTTQKMIDAAVDKAKQMIDVFFVGRAPYEYRKTNELKYKMYDDLARCND